jgi:hypothetical protein
MTLGRNNAFITAIVESCPCIQSIVVVTSPIGVQAPPALAATTIQQLKIILSLEEGMILLSNEIIKMVVVRLSKMLERKKERIAIIHKRCLLDRVWISFVINLNPL